MRKGKYLKKTGFNFKPLMMLVAMVLVVGITVGGTLAWLTDTTEPVTNTFTAGNINIKLAETKTDFKMVPGATIEKDPKVTVEAGSEASWVFVKVVESSNLDDYITYTIATDWIALGDAYPGVYYRQQAATTTDVTYSVLTGNQVTVKTSVTKADMDKLVADDPETEGNESTYPTLTFTAYAIQSANLADQNGDNVVDAADAWTLISTPATTN